MADNGSRIRIDAQGDVSSITGGDNQGIAGRDVTGSAGRDISGTVTNTLNQLSGSPEQVQLKAYLTELLDAIATDDALPAADKADAQEAVSAIAQAAQSDNSDEKQSAIARATRTLNRMTKALPDATKFVRSVNRLIPLIAGLLGI